MLESAGIALSRYVSSITEKERKNILRDEFSGSDRNYPKTDFSKFPLYSIIVHTEINDKFIPMAVLKSTHSSRHFGI